MISKLNYLLFFFLKIDLELHTSAKLEIYAQMSKLLIDFIGSVEELGIHEAKDLLALFGKLSCNCFNISDQEMNYIGVGLYPLASIINHSCSPNSLIIFEGKKAVVRSLEPIEPGTEVIFTISFICLYCFSIFKDFN